MGKIAKSYWGVSGLVFFLTVAGPVLMPACSSPERQDNSEPVASAAEPLAGQSETGQEDAVAGPGPVPNGAPVPYHGSGASAETSDIGGPVEKPVPVTGSYLTCTRMDQIRENDRAIIGCLIRDADGRPLVGGGKAGWEHGGSEGLSVKKIAPEGESIWQAVFEVRTKDGQDLAGEAASFQVKAGLTAEDGSSLVLQQGFQDFGDDPLLVTPLAFHELTTCPTGSIYIGNDLLESGFFADYVLPRIPVQGDFAIWSWFGTQRGAMVANYTPVIDGTFTSRNKVELRQEAIYDHRDGSKFAFDDPVHINRIAYRLCAGIADHSEFVRRYLP